MEEKILIKSEQYNIKRVFAILVIIGLILSLVIFASNIFNWSEMYDAFSKVYVKHKGIKCDTGYYSGGKCYDCRVIIDNPNWFGYVIPRALTIESLIPFPALSIIGGIVYLCLSSYELTVSNKRIYGKVAWGKRVDLPVDSISATAMIRVLKGVSVSTSSGRISFRVIKNADAIYKIMNDLLIERQQEKTGATIVTNMPASDEADKIKKYKELLDSGVITQEEFDAKKKQLLDL